MPGGVGYEEVAGLVEGQVIELHRGALEGAAEEGLRVSALSGDAGDLSADDVGQVQPSVLRAELRRGVDAGAIGVDAFDGLGLGIDLEDLRITRRGGGR